MTRVSPPLSVRHRCTEGVTHGSSQEIFTECWRVLTSKSMSMVGTARTGSPNLGATSREPNEYG